MKNLSVKLKITLWYTLFMTLLVALTLGLVFWLGGSRLLSEAELRLKGVVTSGFKEIEYEHGALEFDDDLRDPGSGVYLSVYDGGGNLLYGRIPAGFEGASMLVMDEVQQVASGQEHWYVYDYCQAVEGYGNLWIRGIISQSQADAALRTVARVAVILLPFLALCIARGGYSIIRRALEPLSARTETARRISEGSDLSQRIRLGPGEDEVHRLAHTFDGMMERLEESFENERQFTSDVSHELRTPVAVILSQCEYASRPDAAQPEIDACLQAVSRQARKMSALISQLLTLARTHKGAQALSMEQLDLSGLAQAVAEEQQDSAAARGISIETRIPPGLAMGGDETMIMRLLINLVSNAVSYGREGGHILIRLWEDGESVGGCVEDDGIGIAPGHLDKIWNRFYQVDPARNSRQEGGAGLGLPMVKWIARAHGGRVWAESIPGEGSVFSFVFPKCREP